MMRKLMILFCGVVASLLGGPAVFAQPGEADLYISNPVWEFNAMVCRKTGVVVKGKFKMPNGRWHGFSPSYGRSGQHEIKITGHPAYPQQYIIRIKGQRWEYRLPALNPYTDYYLVTPKGVNSADYEVMDVPGGAGLHVHKPWGTNGFLRMKRE